jgi:hypothetical protein
MCKLTHFVTYQVTINIESGDPLFPTLALYCECDYDHLYGLELIILRTLPDS